MPRNEDLFDLSIQRKGKYADLLVKRPEYKELVTFSENKAEPVYNWFYYKEGFSRDLVWNLLKELKIPRGLILDPFCGTGTTLLAAKQAGYGAIGFDILPLGVFVSNTKLADGYDMDLLQKKIREITSYKFGPSTLKWVDPGFIDMRKAFSSYARNDIMFFKEKICGIDDAKIRNFLFLGLLSIVSEASNTKKDGGVIRIVKKKHLPPVRYLLKNRLKKMYKDLKRMPPAPEAYAEARMGDARDLPLEPGTVDACITSPPYLNYVDYTKLYGLELSLLLGSTKEILELRKSSLRSHVGAEYKKRAGLMSKKLDKTLEELKEVSVSNRFPDVLVGYFEDMYLSMENTHSALKKGGIAAYVVGNTCLPELTVDVDLILAELGEHIGYTPKEILVANARWCDVAGIRKDRPVRESIVVLEK